jgi:hypothetical protein
MIPSRTTSEMNGTPSGQKLSRVTFSQVLSARQSLGPRLFRVEDGGFGVDVTDMVRFLEFRSQVFGKSQLLIRTRDRPPF